MNPTRLLFLRQTALLAAAVLLTEVALAFGALPLYGLRRLMSRRLSFVITVVATCLVLIGLRSIYVAAALLTQAVMVGVFFELDEKNVRIRRSGFLSLFAGLLTATLTAVTWMLATGAEWKAQLTTQLEAGLKALTDLGVTNLPKVSDVMGQLPSAIIVVLMFSLFFAVLTRAKKAKNSILEIRNPDAMIWFLIASVSLSFVHHGREDLRLIGLNILNVVSVCYFFQGLAVAASYLKKLKVNQPWQGLILVFVSIQFMVVSAIGVVDYWIDFRKRLKGKNSEAKQEI